MRKSKFNCPAEMCVALIGGKWKAILLYNLRRGPRRFGDLKRGSPGITSATLTKELRQLAESGLIQRRELGAERTDGVSYALTARGESLKPILYAMIRWGVAHQRHYASGEFAMAAFQT